MAIQTKSVRNMLVSYDDRYANRWVDAAGANVVKWELPVGLPVNDLTGAPDGWTVTDVGVNTIAASTDEGVLAKITTGATAYNGVNIQIVGSAFQLDAGMPCYFGARIAVEDGNVGDYLFGLCEVDTTLMATSSAHAVSVTDDGVYFYQLTIETAMTFVNELGGTTSTIASGVTTGDATYHDYEFYFDGTTLYAYVDGTEIGSIAADIADQALTPSINVRAGAGGAEFMNIQWMRAIQIR
jgi:hypothetical protein